MERLFYWSAGTFQKIKVRINFFPNIKQKIPLVAGFIVGLLGLEPRKTAPKTVVLPLHHRPDLLNASANLEQILFYTNNYTKKLKTILEFFPGNGIINL